MKRAVCILLWSGNDVLVVSRRNDTQKWGLPGGKVDPGETDEEAAIRELYEETGFSVSTEQLTSVYEAQCGQYTVKTFSVSGESSVVKQYTAPEANEILTKFAPLAFICEQNVSPFAEYNSGLRDIIYFRMQTH